MKVYFKLSKKKLAESNILDLTPNKLYEANSHHTYDKLKVIIDDKGAQCTIRVRPLSCTHLESIATWIKYTPKKV